METSRFKRNKEDFVCEHCGFEVKGSGYTNHCPKCLWSKHVDVNPGDRKAECRGMMKPVAIEGKTNEHVLVNRCEVCGYEKRNRTADDDDIDALLAVITEKIAQQSRR